MIHLHHVHLFSRDLTAAIAWHKRALGAEVCYDGDFGGSRNVLMKIGWVGFICTRKHRETMAEALYTI
jgi:hypothetical protein